MKFDNCKHCRVSRKPLKILKDILSNQNLIIFKLIGVRFLVLFNNHIAIAHAAACCQLNMHMTPETELQYVKSKNLYTNR